MCTRAYFRAHNAGTCARVMNLMRHYQPCHLNQRPSRPFDRRHIEHPLSSYLIIFLVAVCFAVYCNGMSSKSPL